MLSRSRCAPLVWALGSLRLCERCSQALALAVTRTPLRRAHGDVKTDYEALVAAGELNFDTHQQTAVERLQRLQRQLAGYESPPPPSFLGKVGIPHVYIMWEYYVYVMSCMEQS